MAKLKSIASIRRAPGAPDEVPDDALLLIEIGGRVYKLTKAQLAAAAGGGTPSAGSLYLSDGVTTTGTPVEYVDSKYQFVDADKMVCQGGATTMVLHAYDQSTSLLVPITPFATDDGGFADGAALGTPVHGVVVMGQEFAVTGGTVTMTVTNNVVSASFTPD